MNNGKPYGKQNGKPIDGLTSLKNWLKKCLLNFKWSNDQNVQYTMYIKIREIGQVKCDRIVKGLKLTKNK